MINQKKNTFKGSWWKYGDEDNKIPGILEIKNNKIITLTSHVLFPVPNGVHTFPETVGTILGETLDKKLITLLNCESVMGFNYNTPMVLVGEHYRDFDEVKFKKIKIRYSLLNEWAYSDWIESYTVKNKKVIMNYLNKGVISVNIAKLNLNINFHFNLNKVRGSKSNKKRVTFMSIESQESKNLTEWWDIIIILRNLIILGMNMPVYPYRFIGISDKQKEIKMYRIAYAHDFKGLRELNRKGYLFTLKDIEKNFPVYLNDWFNKSITLNRIVTNYYSILNNTDIYNIDKLLNYVSLLEGYHRYNKINEIIRQREYIDEAEKILIDSEKCLEKKQIKFLEKYINPYGYEKRLSKRLRELLNENRVLIKLSRKEKNKFIKKVKDTRDFWAHKLVLSKSGLLKGAELSKAVIALEMLLVVCILREIGFTDELLKRIFERQHNKFTYYYNRTDNLFKFK